MQNKIRKTTLIKTNTYLSEAISLGDQTLNYHAVFFRKTVDDYSTFYDFFFQGKNQNKLKKSQSSC